jgi:hypothetical protein
MSSGKKADLLSWIATGILAGAVPGMSKSEVRDLWGPPAGWASTVDYGDIEDFMDADWWGHGVWSSYFEDHVFDSTTCCISELVQAEWYFEMAPIDAAFFNDIDVAEKMLIDAGIPCFRPPKIIRLKNMETGEVSEHRRRLALPTLLAGKNFQSRIIFDFDGPMRSISNPVSIRRQVVSYTKSLADNGYAFDQDLLRDGRASAENQSNAEGQQVGTG